MSTTSHKNLGFITHLSGFGGFLFPFGSIIIPMVIRESKKEESAYYNKMTKDVVNFNLSYLLYTYLLKITIFPLFIGKIFLNINYSTNNDNMSFVFNDSHPHFFGFLSIAFLLTLLTIVKAVLIIKAAIKTNDGEDFKYPYTIEFIK